MGLFSRIVNWAKNGYAVISRFNPYFENLNFDLDCIKLINEEIPPDITNIYNQIKATEPKKYEKQIILYEQAVSKIKEHNIKVKKINEGMVGFDYNSIISNPRSFDYPSINKYVEIANLIKQFKNYGNPYTTFVQNVENIQRFYNDLVEEYDAFELYNKLAIINPDSGYIDSNTRNEIIQQREIIKAKIDKHEKHFYVWSDNSTITNIIAEHNEEFINKNISNPIFDNINGKTLDLEQRRSVLTDELSTLVVAGAGSGKTLTICGKVEYLLKVKNVDPSDILLLSYSKKSADDLQTKINKIDNRLTVGTFHKIGLDILKETQNKTFMVEDQYKAIIEAYFPKTKREQRFNASLSHQKGALFLERLNCTIKNIFYK